MSDSTSDLVSVSYVPAVFRRAVDIAELIKYANETGSGGKFGLKSIIASVITSLVISLITLVVFCLLRPNHTVVYAPKLKYADEKHQPPRVDRGFFSWIKPLVRMKEGELLERLGLDAVLYLRTLRMLRYMFSVLALIGCCMLIPVNVIINLKSSTFASSTLSTNPLALLSIEGIYGKWLAFHIACAWLFTAIVAYFIHRNYVQVLRLKGTWFRSMEYQAALSSRTLMVTDIPSKWRNDDAFRRLANEISEGQEYAQARIGREVKNLPDLIEDHEQAVRKLEKLLASYLKNPDKLPSKRPTTKDPKTKEVVDAIDYFTDHIAALEAKIETVRESIDEHGTRQYGFVSYAAIPYAHQVARKRKRKSIKGVSTTLCPPPQDILWKNLNTPKPKRRTNRFIGSLLFFALSVLWIVPNALIATFISNIYNLGLVWPAFQSQIYRYPTFWAIMQGVLAPIILAMFFMLLPSIMRRISVWQGDMTKSSRERSVMSKLYFFFVVNNLLIFTLFGTAWNLVAAIITAAANQDGTNVSIWNAIKDYHLLDNAAGAVVGVSTFWITYLVQRNLSVLLDLVQLVSLLIRTFKKNSMAPTPREMIEWTAPQNFDYASYYNAALFYATIGLSYGLIAPLVLPFAVIVFWVSSFLYKYNLMYVSQTKIESGGRYWRMMVNRLIFASCFANVVFFAIVWVQYDILKAVYVAPLPFLMVGFKLYLTFVFDPQVDYYIPGGPKKGVEVGAMPSPPMAIYSGKDRLADRFGHSSLHQPLAKVMVHAKARHLLPYVYQGKNGPAPTTGMLNTGAAPATYEVVAENELDFGKYKDRADFAEFRQDDGDVDGNQKNEESFDLVTQTEGMLSHPQPPQAYDPAYYHDRTPSAGVNALYPQAYNSSDYFGKVPTNGSGMATPDDRFEMQPVMAGGYVGAENDRQGLLTQDTGYYPPRGPPSRQASFASAASAAGMERAGSDRSNGYGQGYDYYRQPR
ncbi:hypothetical protein YB2330_006382 [Saitoella coloradoensis]